MWYNVIVPRGTNKRKEVIGMTAAEYVTNKWGYDFIEVVCKATPINMPMEQFLSHCVMCGGNWNGMLLSGIKHFCPDVYEAIPENMGACSFATLSYVLELLGVTFHEEEI